MTISSITSATEPAVNLTHMIHVSEEGVTSTEEIVEDAAFVFLIVVVEEIIQVQVPK